MSEIEADDTLVSSNVEKLGKENLIYDMNKEEETAKTEIFEERFDSEETTREKEVKETKTAESSNHVNGELQDANQQKSEEITGQLNGSKLTSEELNSTFDMQKRMPSYQRLTQSKSLKTGTSLVGKSGNASSQIQNSKLPKNLVKRTKSAIQSGKDKVLALTKKVNSSQVENVEVTSPGSKSLLHKQTSVGPTRPKYTVPQPFSLATEKRASLGSQHSGKEVAQNDSRRSSNVIPPVAEKKKMMVKSASAVSETKLSQSVVQKTRALAEASKSRMSNVTAASGSASRSNERAQKRKEINSKVEEKLNAKEEEKRQLQVKTKEQEGDQLKKLRRSLSFKASRMPDFSHEVSPPKLELKKTPPTRAKSPKLGRKKNSSPEPEDNITHSHRRSHSVEFIQQEKSKTPYKGNSAVKKTIQSVSTKIPEASTKKKSSREAMSTKQKAFPGLRQNGIPHASVDNGSTATSALLQGSQSSTIEEKVGLEEDDGVSQQNEYMNRQSMTFGSDTDPVLTVKSENLTAIAETAALIENIQISVASH